MQPENKKRFSFTDAAATTTQRQRFSFAEQKPETKTLADFFPAKQTVAAATPFRQPEPTIGQKAKEFVLPGRGFTAEETMSAKPGLKDVAVGTAKAVGEIGLGLGSLAPNILPIAAVANKVYGFVPGYKETYEKTLTKAEETLKPKTAEEAKVMRTADIAGFLPLTAARISKVSRLDELSKLAKNSIENAPTGVRDSSLDFLRKNPTEVTNGEVRLREIEDGSIVIEDGRHRLQVGKETGVVPKIVDVTAEYTGKPSTKIAALTKDIRERGFVTSVKEKVPESSKVAGQYVVRDTDELAIKARNEVASNPDAAEAYIKANTDERSVAMAAEFIKKFSDDAARASDKAQADALYDRVADLANDMAARLTETGRTIQAASILGRLTPEGQIRFAAREIQRYNRLNPTKRIPELSGEQARFISDEMKAINQMPMGDEKAMRFQKLQTYVQDLVPTPLWKKVTTVWKAGLLTGLKTTGLNIFSNLFHTASEVVKDIPAVVVDRASSLFTGERTKTLTMRGAFDGMKEGAIKGKRYFSTGFDERNIGEKLDYTRVNFGKGPVAQAFRVYTDTVFRVMGATDQPFYYATLSRSLMDQALAQGMNQGLKGKQLVDYAYSIVDNPTEEMIRYATSDAATAVFMNKTELGKAASTVQKIPVVGEIFIPFARTPSAVAMQIISYSPAGFVKSIVNQIKAGKFDQRMFSQDVGRALTGSAVLAVGYKLAEEGLMTFDYPIGDEREQELQKIEGRKNNAIKIGDKWRSPMSLGPIGNVLLIGGQFQKAIKEHGSPTEAFAQAVLASAKAFTESTFLTGLSDAINAIMDPQRYAKQYLPNLAASFVPTIVSDVARATDPLERQANTTLEKIQARIPGVREGLEPQVDVLGQEIESVGNPLEILLDPTRPSPIKDNPVANELRRLTDAGYKVSPTKLGDRAGYEVLTPEQNTELWQKSGDILNSKLSNLFSSSVYQQAPDDKKAKIVEEFVEKSKNNARAVMVVQLTDGLEGDALRTKLSELKEGGLMTRDVFRIYTEIK